MSMDGLEDTIADRPARPTLIYPLGDPPPAGEVKQVAPGVLWVRMPLPFALRWINLWLIEDGVGWTLVDTGIQSDETREHWARIFAATLKGKPITRVICTHMHPDHLGLAGWMTRKFQCPLWITRLEYLMCRHLVADTGREAPEDGVRFYREAGWSESDLDSYRVHFGGFGKAIHALPDSYRRIVDGEEIVIGGRLWRVIVGSGHSPEHACLHQPDLNVLISGDQLLPRISSNVSVFPTEPAADPLSEWLASCAKLKAATPEDVLVLPAHNEPFRGAHLRLDNLIADHERGLERLEGLLEQAPRRAIDVFGALFSRTIGPDLLSMATGESLAHLNCLLARGRATRRVSSEGIAWYGPR
jgi:glyoxylase-like metal-dependent hydrolase (beta-lactamase superfamily II)